MTSKGEAKITRPQSQKIRDRLVTVAIFIECSSSPAEVKRVSLPFA
jgi:hypothetical protein